MSKATVSLCCAHYRGCGPFFKVILTLARRCLQHNKREEPRRLACFSHRCHETSRLGTTSAPGAWNKGEAEGHLGVSLGGGRAKKPNWRTGSSYELFCTEAGESEGLSRASAVFSFSGSVFRGVSRRVMALGSGYFTWYHVSPTVHREVKLRSQNFHWLRFLAFRMFFNLNYRFLFHILLTGLISG